MRRSLANRSYIKQTQLRLVFEEDQGSETVEFALALPILVMISFGAFELLLFLSCFVGATYGSKAAVRYGSTHGASSLSPCTSATLTSIVKSYIVGLPGGQITVTPSWVPSNAVGGALTVQVTMTYATGIPFTAMKSLSASTTATGVIVQ